jgi:hypothetical protein
MWRRNKVLIYRTLVLLVALVVVVIRFGDFFSPPFQRVIEPWGDGFKAYTVIWYHAKYDSTYSHFEGMNYPYGEHVIPAATQPMISNTIKWISDNIIDIADWTIPIVNFSLLLGVILSIFFLYLIFRKLGTPFWYALAVGVGLTFLSPQLMRMSSHYGLAHMEVLPIILYLLLLWDERPRWSVSIALALVIWIYAQIHFYFFAIMVFTISFFFLFRFLQRWDWKKLGFYALHYGVMVVVPLVYFMVWLNWNDAVDDRTEAPWGFFAYRGRWEAIYTSLRMPHWIWLDKNGVEVIEVNSEGQAYIGLVAAFGVIVLALQWLWYRLRRPLVKQPEAFRPFLNHLFWGCFAILLFSIGYPFIIPGWEGLLDYAGPIKQFRSIGRFAWAFYYGINIVVFAALWHWADHWQKWRKGVLALALVVLGYEAYQFAYSKTIDLDRIPHFEAPDRFTDLEIDFSEYQAILPVPYYNIGSDQYWYPMSGLIGQRTLTLSAQTGLPITGGMLTRTSHRQTRQQLQLVQEPYRIPSILKDYPSDKPLLLAWNDDRKGDYGMLGYSYLLDGADLIYEEEDLKLYRLPLQTYADRIDDRRKGIKRSIDANWLNKIDGFWTNDTLPHFLQNRLDDQPSDRVYLGDGAYQGVMQDTNTIFKGTLPNQKVGRYQFSVWMYVAEDQAPRTMLRIEERSPVNGELWNYKNDFVYRHVKVLEDSGWGLVEYTFEVTSSGSVIHWQFSNEELGSTPIYLDELLIWKTGKEVMLENDTLLWHNNRWFPKGAL